MKRLRILPTLAVTLCLSLFADSATAFCGFYVAKADTDLFNEASKVVLARHEDKNVITMSSDYQGDLKEFSIVVPVPTFIEKDQIHISNSATIDHLDAYTAPRLVEYYDEDPCMKRIYKESARMALASSGEIQALGAARAAALGVKIEAEYTVGEYDIIILSANESDGLVTWLNENDYKMPDGADEILGSYIKQDMKFFVASVNLEEQSKTGFQFLRPIAVAYESPKFMLPVRLGTLNANGPQELFVFTLTQKGRVESTNYRTTKIPTGQEIPLYVADEFGEFYRGMFDRQVEKEGMKTIFLEYAWDMGWCDPCAADPLTTNELRELGVFWVENPEPTPRQGRRPPRPILSAPQPQNVFVTRMHLRYTAETFPEDIQFQETADRENYQGRYVLRHPWTGDADCEEAKAYFKGLPAKFETQATNLAKLTGWDIEEIRAKMSATGQSFEAKEWPNTAEKKWYQKLWD